MHDGDAGTLIAAVINGASKTINGGLCNIGKSVFKVLVYCFDSSALGWIKLQILHKKILDRLQYLKIG